MSINSYLGHGEFVEGAGEIYAVRIKDWDTFEPLSKLIVMSHESLQLKESVNLLDFLVAQGDDIRWALTKLLNICFRVDDFSFYSEKDSNYYDFRSGEMVINKDNYNDFISIVKDQNLILPPKIFTDPLVQKFVEKKIKAMNKDSGNTSLEDMISTVAVKTGKFPWEMADYTIYQLKMDFKRIETWEGYTLQMMAQPHVSEPLKPKHFAETIDLKEDPYKDIFPKKGKLNMEKAFKDK